MSKVAIVTDSTAYIPKNLLDQYHIQVAPLMLVWGAETFQDGIDIRPSDFYTRLKTAKSMPTTSQVIPSNFHQIFCRLLDQDYDILAVLISSNLSGTVASAIQARDLLPSAANHIEIVDSQTTAMALGFQALAAARAAAEGATLKECRQLVEQTKQQTGIIFAVDTLEFLHRGGRIGGASRFLGTALNIKPILEVHNGRVEPLERVRTRKKSIDRVIELLDERIGGRTPVHLASVNANAAEDARQALMEAQKRFNAIETISTDVSPVIGAHTGPGTVGLAYLVGV